MFELEIEQLKKFLTAQLPHSQPYVFLREVLSTETIAESYKRFFTAEADWWLYEEQNQWLDHHRFDTSTPEFTPIFKQLDDMLRQNAHFDHDTLISTIDLAVKVRLNFLCRPRTTLLWFVYRSEPTKTIYEILLRLEYLTDYSYLTKGFYAWARKTYSSYPAMDLLSVVEFQKIIETIDNEYILDLSPHQFVDLLHPLFEFFNPNTTNQDEWTIPTEALIVFLDDKKVDLIAQELERLLNENNVEQISQVYFLEVVINILSLVESGDIIPDIEVIEFDNNKDDILEYNNHEDERAEISEPDVFDVTHEENYLGGISQHSDSQEESEIEFVKIPNESSIKEDPKMGYLETHLISNDEKVTAPEIVVEIADGEPIEHEDTLDFCEAVDSLEMLDEELTPLVVENNSDVEFLDQNLTSELLEIVKPLPIIEEVLHPEIIEEIYSGLNTEENPINDILEVNSLLTVYDVHSDTQLDTVISDVDSIEDNLELSIIEEAPEVKIIDEISEITAEEELFEPKLKEEIVEIEIIDVLPDSSIGEGFSELEKLAEIPEVEFIDEITEPNNIDELTNLENTDEIPKQDLKEYRTDQELSEEISDSNNLIEPVESIIYTKPSEIKHEVQLPSLPRWETIIDLKLKDKFVKKLFDGNDNSYHKLLGELDTCTTWAKADTAIIRYLIRANKKHTDSIAVEFGKTIQKRFLENQ